jgi:hypothetical protein
MLCYKQMQIKQVKVKDINTDGPIRNPLLPTGIVLRIQKFKRILAEVETSTVEETILNFQHDEHQEKELKTWEHIAFCYQNFIKANASLTLEKKKDVFTMLLCLSMGMDRFDTVKNLDEQQIGQLRKKYFEL